LTDDFSDNPPVVELQVIPKVNTTDEVVKAAASVMVWLPLVALVPGQLSSDPPPVAVQLVALDDFHVSVVDCPGVMVVDEAEIDAVSDFPLPPPLDPEGARSSITLVDALAESPLVVELQVIMKVRVTDGASRAKGSITVWLPLVALVPAQLSSGLPPVAVQLVAFEEFQVSVVDFPAVMAVGEAEIATVTAGQLQTTGVDTLTAGTPGAVQFSV
jgi:hypothetical protein